MSDDGSLTGQVSVDSRMSGATTRSSSDAGGELDDGDSGDDENGKGGDDDSDDDHDGRSPRGKKRALASASASSSSTDDDVESNDNVGKECASRPGRKPRMVKRFTAKGEDESWPLVEGSSSSSDSSSSSSEGSSESSFSSSEGSSSSSEDGWRWRDTALKRQSWRGGKHGPINADRAQKMTDFDQAEMQQEIELLKSRTVIIDELCPHRYRPESPTASAEPIPPRLETLCLKRVSECLQADMVDFAVGPEGVVDMVVAQLVKDGILDRPSDACAGVMKTLATHKPHLIPPLLRLDDLFTLNDYCDPIFEIIPALTRLYLNGMDIRRHDILHQITRNAVNLESLIITNCRFADKDFRYLAIGVEEHRAPRALKHLVMTGSPCDVRLLKRFCKCLESLEEVVYEVDSFNFKEKQLEFESLVRHRRGWAGYKKTVEERHVLPLVEGRMLHEKCRRMSDSASLLSDVITRKWRNKRKLAFMKPAPHKGRKVTLLLACREDSFAPGVWGFERVTG